MHYYKRNIGDYHKKAGRLSMLEHGAYTLLIDAYYDREIAPTKEQALDWCWARTTEEVAAVEFVLSKFFTLDGDVYRQSRIEDEIERYHEKAKINKRIAKEREENKRKERKRSEHEPCTDEHEPTPNHKPITNNQEPETNNQSNTGDKSPKKKSSRFVPPTVEQVAEYCKQRGNSINPKTFVDYYSSSNWMRGNTKIKDWKACVRTWETKAKDSQAQAAPRPQQQMPSPFDR